MKLLSKLSVFFVLVSSVFAGDPSCEHWGYHLILDCKGCDKASVTNRDHLDKFIKTLVAEIDMKAFGEPIIEHFAEFNPEAAGFSLVQLIETSSITGHFVDQNGDAYIDVFSCKAYDIEKVKRVVQTFFNPEKIRMTFIHRQA